MTARAADHLTEATASPTVSIITPAYNAAAYIEQAIASVQRQTYTDWELLVVDDCSHDNTALLVTAICERDSRIRLLKQAQNGGPSRARQAALDNARGRYIAFLDSDDSWVPHKLEHQLAFMQAHGAALSFTEYCRISSDGSRLGRRVRVPARVGYEDLLCNTAIATSTVVVDRSVTGSFSMTHTYYDDFALWLELLRRGFIGYGLQEDLTRYRVSSNSWSRNKMKSARWVWRTYREVEKLSFPRSAWCFANYACRALLKHRSF